MANKGTLFLIPNLIAPASGTAVLSPMVFETLPRIRHFLAEDIRSARRYFSKLQIFEAIEDLHFVVLNKDSREEDLNELMKPLLDGFNMGVISESGCPGVADPGSLAVRYAHGIGAAVVPLVGPSSILLSVMASGLNGQRFAFNGYLPIGQGSDRVIREFEKESRKKGQTQIFIETPYRNNVIYQRLIKNLHPETWLCVALDLTGPDQRITTQRVAQWKKSKTEWPKRPAVFLFLATHD